MSIRQLKQNKIIKDGRSWVFIFDLNRTAISRNYKSKFIELFNLEN